MEEVPMPPATTNKTDTPPAYWSMPSEQLLAALHSTPVGLSAAEAARRLA
jgi:hypothetical protein